MRRMFIWVGDPSIWLVMPASLLGRDGYTTSRTSIAIHGQSECFGNDDPRCFIGRGNWEVGAKEGLSHNTPTIVFRSAAELIRWRGTVFGTN